MKLTHCVCHHRDPADILGAACWPAVAPGNQALIRTCLAPTAPLITDLTDGAQKQLLLYKVLDWKTAQGGGVGGGGYTPTDSPNRHGWMQMTCTILKCCLFFRASQRSLGSHCCFYMNGFLLNATRSNVTKQADRTSEIQYDLGNISKCFQESFGCP